jgi:hypothetical protein
MKEKIFFLIIIILVLENCSSKPVILRSAPNQIQEDQSGSGPKKRSANEFPPDASPGHCYKKTAVPAEYKDTEEKVLVKAASSKTESIPAIVETVDEKVIDKEGYTYFKKSDDGMILCMEEVPPTFRTVSKEIVKSPATTKVTEIPAEYDTVNKKQLVKEETVSWEEILCANNATPARIKEIKTKLKENGFDPGTLDGELNEDTMDALNKFQKAKNLKFANDKYIYMETVNALGVKI